MSSINKDKYQNGPKIFGLTNRTSFVDEGDKSIPGPGTHNNIRLNKFNPPQHKIGNSTGRDTFLDKFNFSKPSPLNYDPRIQLTHNNFQPTNPSYSIPQQHIQKSQSKHLDLNNSLLYNPNYHIMKSTIPKYTMGYTQQHNYETQTPAPNQYNIVNNDSMKQTKVYFNKTQKSFTISNRPLPYGEEGKWPGVGEYKVDTIKPTTYQYTIGKSDRPQTVIGKDSPGNFYQISGNLKTPGAGKTFGMLYYPKKSDNQIIPGPNHYNPIDIKQNKNIITTYSNRIPLQNTAIIKYPSPQKYNTTTSDFNYRRKSLSFTQDRRDKTFFNNNPGPGAHNVISEFNTKCGVMGRKLKQTVKLITPAADHYSPNKQFIKQSSPRIVNFYSNRVDFSKSLTGKQVGPGSYQIDKTRKAELGRMSKSMKFGKDNNFNPGPGYYDIPNSIGKLPKYYSGTKKLTQQGYTTFTIKMWQKQKKNQEIKQHQRQEQQKQQQQKQIKQNQNNQMNDSGMI